MTTPDHDRPDARVVRHEMEVPGSPEEIWEAIATGPGLATWFVPAEVEEREGGEIVTRHGPFGESRGRVTAWDPPRRFRFDEPDWSPGEADAPPWATEILVEATSGDTCIVRLVSGFFQDGDGWEDHLEGTDEGWWLGLKVLQLYRRHHPGQPAAQLWASHITAREADDVEAELRERLALSGVDAGAAVLAPPDSPSLAGTVVKADHAGVLVHTREPVGGVVHLSVQRGATLSLGGFDPDAAIATVHGIFYGPDAADVAPREEDRWNAWLASWLGQPDPDR